METIKFLNSFLTSFIITFIAIPVVIRLIRLNSLIISPETRDKRLYIPSFGGIAIFLGILISFIFWIDFKDSANNIIFLLPSLLILFFVGIIDDFVKLKPWKKILGQVFAISIFLLFEENVKISSMYGVFSGNINSELSLFWSICLTVFTMLVIINSYNLIDGVDGLAGSIGVLVAFFFALLFFVTNEFYLTFLACALIGSLIAFLFFNNYPAKIFMGDTGSMIIGFIFAVFAINIVESQILIDHNFEFISESQQDKYIKSFIFLDLRNKGPLVAISILIIPLFDTLRVFILRLIKKNSPFQGDTNHMHHNLLECGLKPSYISILFVLVNFILTFCLIIFLSELGINIALLILFVVSFLLSLIPKYFFKKNE